MGTWQRHCVGQGEVADSVPLTAALRRVMCVGGVCVCVCVAGSSCSRTFVCVATTEGEKHQRIKCCVIPKERNSVIVRAHVTVCVRPRACEV